MSENYYRILGLSNSASEEEIRIAYRKLAKKYHPDKHGGSKEYEEIFKRVSMAYEVLADPSRKSRFDEQLNYQKYQGTTSEQVKTKPVAERRSKEYTPIAWMYGKIFILALILVCLLIPYLLFHYSSVFRYEEGLEFEKKGQYVNAVNAYKEAISFWGARNVEACFRAGLVLSENGAPREALSFFRSALKYTAIDSVEGALHWYASMTLMKSKQYEQALEEINFAGSYGFPEDSLQRRSGEIHAFYLQEYAQADKNFTYLINRNIFLDEAWFGKGWCQNNLFRYDAAIEAYTQSLKYNPDQIMAIYNRGISYYYSNDSLGACADFLRGKQLGHGLAKATFEQYCTDSTKSFLPPTEN